MCRDKALKNNVCLRIDAYVKQVKTSLFETVFLF